MMVTLLSLYGILYIRYAEIVQCHRSIKCGIIEVVSVCCDRPSACRLATTDDNNKWVCKFNPTHSKAGNYKHNGSQEVPLVRV